MSLFIQPDEVVAQNQAQQRNQDLAPVLLIQQEPLNYRPLGELPNFDRFDDVGQMQVESE
jgi:hypothetical protein